MLLIGNIVPFFLICFSMRSVESEPFCFQATVYRCLPGGEVETVQIFEDRDASEEYYICRWSLDTRSGAPWLVVAGKKGLLLVINCITGMLDACLEGHGQSINDISVHPTHPELIITASKDHSLRLWNLHTGVCVLVLHGDGGHRSEVLSTEWCPGGELILVSGGMDDYVKLWDLRKYSSTINKSRSWQKSSCKGFLTKRVQIPAFSSQGVHWNYVDCVVWMGSYLLSKSVDDKIICWSPKYGQRRNSGLEELLGDDGEGSDVRNVRRPDDDITLVQILELSSTKDVWWMRFGVDPARTLLAQGNACGEVYVYDLTTLNPRPIARLEPQRQRGKGEEGLRKLLVRQTAISFDGNIIISCHEDGSLTRFDRE